MNSNKALLTLLSIAVDNCNDYSLMSDVDWGEVYKIAERQGVLGVAFDGIQKLPKSLLPEMDLLMDWLGQSEYYKSTYELYSTAIAHLNNTLTEAGFQIMILKGFGCSVNYPNPASRPVGDIDIWAYGNYSEIDNYVYSLGIEVLHENAHHSVFTFENFTIENHQTILDVHTHKSSLFLEQILEELAIDSQRHVYHGSSQILIPSARFNSIHLLRHMANDFATVKTTIRQVLDWATFCMSNEIDWIFVHETAKATNMWRFLDCINTICVEHLAYPESKFPIIQHDTELSNRVLEDILNYKDNEFAPREQVIRYGLQKSKRIWQNRWKYNIVYNESIVESFWWAISNRLKHLR